MDLLFRREQTGGDFRRVDFKLWGKVELDEEEQSLIERYRFRDAILIVAFQPELLRQAAGVGFAAFFVSGLILAPLLGLGIGSSMMLGTLLGVGVGFWWYHEKRETIFVRDLLHGRYFKCDSVVDLARKEAWLSTVVSYLRQVMVTAKHWDGTERQMIEPLPKDEARQVILRGL